MLASLVNLNDLVLIGPGSEWFWTAISGIVLATTFFALYRQLRGQSAANALQRIETIHGRWTSKELLLARLEVALALRDGTLDLTNDSRVDAIVDFFDLVENLRAQRYLGTDEIARAYGPSIQLWWRLLGSQIREARVVEGDPELWDGIEKLTRVIDRFDRKRGVQRVLGSEMPTDVLLAAIIERSRRRLQLIHEADSGVIPDTTPPVAQPEVQLV